MTSDRISRRAWFSLAIVTMGTLMVTLDTTLVNVALPEIGRDWNASTSVDWIVTIYLFGIAVAQPGSARLFDAIGGRRLFAYSLGAFGFASLLAGLAPTFPLLVLARAVQGVAGGAMIPTGLAILYSEFSPQRRGTVVGWWSFASMLAPAIGPVVGGWLISVTSWRWAFLVNVPVAVVGVPCALRVLSQSAIVTPVRIAWAQWFWVSTALFSVLLALSEAEHWGWTSAATITLLLGGGVVMVAVGRVMRRSADSLIELSLFGQPAFDKALVIVWLASAAFMTRLVFVPLELEAVRSAGPLVVGITLVPAAVVSMVVLPLIGRAVDRVGPRWLVVAGGLCLAASSAGLARVEPAWSLATIAAIMSLHGVGAALALVPATTSAFDAVAHRHVPQVSMLRAISRNLSASLTIALLGAVFAATLEGSSPDDLQAAYNGTFALTVPLGLGTAVVGLLLPNSTRTAELRASRHEEFTAAAGAG